MKQKKIWIAAIGLLCVIACTKVLNTNIGAGELIPPVDGVNVKDTIIDIFGKTWGEDTVSVPITVINMLGNTQNPTFGSLQSSINIQMQPGIDSFSFPVGKDSLQLDSVVLVLGTAGAVYGDSTKNLGFRVYEIANSANFDVNSGYPYNSNLEIPRGNELTYNGMAASINPLKTKDSIASFQDTTINQLRIRLNTTFGNKLLKDYTFNNEYKTDSTFRRAFKGFQIVPENAGNALIPILLTNTNTKLAIYYSYVKRDGTGKDTTVTYFRPNYNSASSNYIKRDRTGSQISENYPIGDLGTSDNYLYVEGSPGTYSRISFPNLVNFPKSLLYKAELIIDQVPNTADASEKYFSTPNLFIAGYDSINHRRFNLTKDVPPTLASNGLSYTTGSSSISALGSYAVKVKDTTSATDSLFQYHLNITKHIQDVLIGKAANLPLDIYAPSGSDSVYEPTIGKYIFVGTNDASTGSLSPLNHPGVGQLRLGGPTDVKHRIRLHVIYSPIN